VLVHINIIIDTVKPVLGGHNKTKKKWSFKTNRFLHTLLGKTG
jgi:hypothetical protein